MKILLSLCLILTSSIAAGEPLGTPCGTFPSDYDVSPPQPVKQIERQEMAALSHWRKFMGDLPEVPSGAGHAEWAAFKKAMRRGDKIVRYRSSPHSWEHLAGEAGLAILRSGCIVKTMTTMVN